ncbi:hypothetical protein FM107_18635 [Sphingobacterium sp. JB170]|nr:hypothetical protein FM107_18635 [Sphingobacterium sp. JB170]
MNVIEMVSNPQIVVSATISHKGTTQIRVTDNDGGIPAEIVDRIFIPFFSTKKPELVLV